MMTTLYQSADPPQPVNIVRALGAAFGVDPERFEAIVDAYERPQHETDRLALIEARWREHGCPDGDFAWLLAECKRLRGLEGALERLVPSIDAELSASPGLSRDYPHLYNMLHNWHGDACTALELDERLELLR